LCPEYGCQESKPNDLDADVVDVIDPDEEEAGEQRPFNSHVSLEGRSVLPIDTS
jgi:hypothetical protein